MESEARPPLVAPHEPLPSTSSEEVPVWEPTLSQPLPPPLPCPAKQPRGRALTSKQYKDLSLLQAAVEDGARALAPPPLLPVDLPSVKRLMAAGHASDSEGAVTSKAAGLSRAKAAAQASPLMLDGEEMENLPDQELVSMLEETLMHEGQEEEEEEETDEGSKDQEAGPPGGNGTQTTAAAIERNRGGVSKRPKTTTALEVEETIAGDYPHSAKRTRGLAEGDAERVEEEAPQPRNKQEGDGEEEVRIDLSKDPGKGPISERAKHAALKSIGFASWEDFAVEVAKSAAAVAAAVGGPSARRKAKSRSATSLTLQSVLNPQAAVYHASYARAYKSAFSILEKQEAAKRKAEAREEELAGGREPQRWSSLSAGEHTWYLLHEGKPMSDQDVVRFNGISRKLEMERAEYWNALQREAAASKGRYLHVTERQQAQHAADLDVRRHRALTLPKLWRPKRSVDLVSTSANTTKSRGSTSSSTTTFFPVERELLRRGEPPTLQELKPGSYLPGNKIYLPVPLDDRDGPRGGTLGDVYRKNRTAEIWNDPEMAVAVESIESDVIVCAATGAVLCMLRSALLKNLPEWHVPVEISIHEGGGGQKRIFLGKPLLATRESLRDRQQRLQKYAALSQAFPRPVNEASGSKMSIGSKAAPREAMYWLTSVAGIPMAIRTHSRVLLTPAPSAVIQEEKGEEKEEHPTDHDAHPETSKPAAPREPNPAATEASPPSNSIPCVFAATTEYLSDFDIEEDIPEELITWWLKIALTPGAEAAAVAHVHVPLNQVILWRTLKLTELAKEWRHGANGRAAVRAVEAIIQNLKDLHPGKYLLRHVEGAEAVEVLEEASTGGAEPEDMRSKAATAVEGQPPLFDLHAAQANAGADDPSIDLYIPPKWRPHNPNVAQIPYTFPVAVDRREKGRARRRQRKMAWQGDMDQMQHLGRYPRTEYQAGLYEEL